MWVNTKKATEVFGLSSDTLRRYRRDGVLTPNIDYKYLDAYKRKLAYNTEKVEASIQAYQKKPIEQV